MKHWKIITTLALVIAIGTGWIASALSSSAAYEAATYLAGRGYIVSQSSQADYRLDQHVLRQEVVGTALKVTGASLPDPYSCRGYFTDISSTSPNTWACRAFEMAADASIITRANTTSRPEDDVTRAEALAIIMATKSFSLGDSIQVDSEANLWQSKLITRAYNNGIIDDPEDFGPNEYALRGEVFVWSARVLGQDIQDDGSDDITARTSGVLQFEASSTITDDYLPLGTGKYSSSKAAVGTIYACSTRFGGNGAFVVGDWVHEDEGYWSRNEKDITVSGSVSWSQASFVIDETTSTRKLVGN